MTVDGKPASWSDPGATHLFRQYLEQLGYPIYALPHCWAYIVPESGLRGAARILRIRYLPASDIPAARQLARRLHCILIRGRSEMGQLTWGTYLINLAQPITTLWANLDRAVRKNIRHHDNLTIGVATMHAEYLAYQNLLNTYRLTNGLPPAGGNPWLVHQLAATYPPRPGGNRAEVMVAWRAGRMVSGLGIIGADGVVQEMGVARSPDSGHAQDLIRWAIITTMAANGYHTYDLAGHNPYPTNAKERQIAAHKKRFGGTEMQYRLYEAPGHWPCYLLYRIAKWAKSISK